MNLFDERLSSASYHPLYAVNLTTVQINMGLACNLSCGHCHLEAGQARSEAMDSHTVEKILRAISALGTVLVDITGGSPELNPSLRELVRGASAQGHSVQMRTNLTLFTEEKGVRIAEFLRAHRVALVGSMNSCIQENVDAQRGDGTFSKIVESICVLNEMGYGTQDGLPLNLVYNPLDASLPESQESLEADYRKRLSEDYGLQFTKLLAVTNMPIGRFHEQLTEKGELDDYMQLLQRSFNPATIPGLMCRHQISIGWDGTLYDCDFHLAMKVPCQENEAANIADFDSDELASRQIVTRDYCLGCTAGAGSSCQGALT